MLLLCTPYMNVTKYLRDMWSDALAHITLKIITLKFILTIRLIISHETFQSLKELLPFEILYFTGLQVILQNTNQFTHDFWLLRVQVVVLVLGFTTLLT